MPGAFALTPLVEPQSIANPVPPASFNAVIAYLLGKCCALSYMQYAANNLTLTSDQLATLGSEYTFAQIGNGISVSESIGVGTVVGEAGYYRTVPVGFALKATPASGGQAINIIVLRGTQAYAEWIDDLSAVPTSFHVGTNNGNYYSHLKIAPLGQVHGGFYNLYNQGTNGTSPVTEQHLSGVTYSRPTGSIASQIDVLMGQLDPSLPMYVTGHSLGAALAIICSMDIGTNYPTRYAAGQLAMYNLAGPRVAAGISALGLGTNTSDFINAYGAAVNQTFLIIHSADLVPILPPASINLGSDLGLSFAHVSTNVISFLAQTGDIGGNHSCAGTYVPYLQQLAGGFQTS